jgi:hypothetical protein
MNNWLQKKVYRCPACGAEYVHDKAYFHSLFECPKRKRSASVESCGRADLAHAPLSLSEKDGQI